jgi:hypothetical protein
MDRFGAVAVAVDPVEVHRKLQGAAGWEEGMQNFAFVQMLNQALEVECRLAEDLGLGLEMVPDLGGHRSAWIQMAGRLISALTVHS